MIEVLLEERSVEGVDLIDDIGLDSSSSSLVVEHLGEDVQLGVSEFGLRGLDEEELGETEGWNNIDSPLQISSYHGQILSEIRRIEFCPSKDLSTLGAARVSDRVVEQRSN